MLLFDVYKILQMAHAQLNITNNTVQLCRYVYILYQTN